MALADQFVTDAAQAGVKSGGPVSAPTSLADQFKADAFLPSQSDQTFGNARDKQQAVEMQGVASRIGDLIYGAGKGAADLVQGPAQLILNGANSLNKSLPGYNPNGVGSKYLNDKTNQFNNYLKNQEDQYQSETPNSFSAGLGRLGAGTAPFLLSGGASSSSQVPQVTSAAPEMAAALPKIIQALKSTTSAAAQGGGFGAIQPVTDGGQNFTTSKAQQTGIGSLSGVGGKLLGAIAAKLINPNTAPEVKSLLDQGITPTVGQTLGGVASTIEDKLTSVPILGDMIKNSQRRSIEDLNKAAYNRALAPIGEESGSIVGRDGVQQVKEKLSNAYDALLPNLKFKADPQFSADMQNLTQLASNLPAPQATQFQKILKNTLVSKLGPQGTMDGAALKGAEGDLRNLAKGYSTDQSFDNRQLGNAIDEISNAIRSNLIRSNPDAAKQLQAINQGYANYARIRSAASSLGAENGVFTPAQLQNAVKAQDKSAGKGDFATGNALMQDLSDSGKNILGSKYPDSGTVGRGLVAAAGPLAVGAMTHPLATALAATGGGIAMAPYTPLGQKIAVALLAKRPAAAAPIANGIKSVSPLGGAAVSPALLQMLNNDSQ